jgi:hypothetical protein
MVFIPTFLNRVIEKYRRPFRSCVFSLLIKPECDVPHIFGICISLDNEYSVSSSLFDNHWVAVLWDFSRWRGSWNEGMKEK